MGLPLAHISKLTSFLDEYLAKTPACYSGSGDPAGGEDKDTESEGDDTPSETDPDTADELDDSEAGAEQDTGAANDSDPVDRKSGACSIGSSLGEKQPNKRSLLSLALQLVF